VREKDLGQMSKLFVFGSLVAALAFFAYRLLSSPYEELHCSEADRLSATPPAECFLPENYLQAKAQFLSLAKVFPFHFESSA
jgi:hypothetical protein